MKEISTAHITPAEATLNGMPVAASGMNLNTLYRELIGDYPKFFKMDGLCKLGFIAAEMLLRDMPAEAKEHGAIILFNRSGSLCTDRNYQKTINSAADYFPSPALFVYTLANIVTGEIAIRHKIYGETSFYIMDGNDADAINHTVAGCFATSSPSFILTGWVEYSDDNDYLAEMKLVTK